MGIWASIFGTSSGAPSKEERRDQEAIQKAAAGRRRGGVGALFRGKYDESAGKKKWHYGTVQRAKRMIWEKDQEWTERMRVRGIENDRQERRWLSELNLPDMEKRIRQEEARGNIRMAKQLRDYELPSRKRRLDKWRREREWVQRREDGRWKKSREIQKREFYETRSKQFSEQAEQARKEQDRRQGLQEFRDQGSSGGWKRASDRLGQTRRPGQ